MSLELKEKQIMTALIGVQGIGRGTVRNIKAKLKKEKISWVDFWYEKGESWWKKVGLNKTQRRVLKQWRQQHKPETYFGSLTKRKIKVVTIEDKNYPVLLKEIDDPPQLLFVKGPLNYHKPRLVSVVGTRQISGYGRQVCRQLIPNLVAQEVGIVSGFMYGVDVTAQKLAHQHGGDTIGVLGFGFDYMYPRHQQQLFDELVAAGQTFITEYPPATQPNPGLFPERNRIVAGLSAATLVVEAGKKSGSHITARLAGDFGRGVCAVPGSINNPFSAGTKWLINQGVTLVTTAEEVMDEAGFKAGGWSQELLSAQKEDEAKDQDRKKDKTNKNKFKNQVQAKIYQDLLNEPTTADSLIENLDVSSATVNTHLSLLELRGLIRNEGGRWFAD